MEGVLKLISSILNLLFAVLASTAMVVQNWKLYKRKSTVGYSTDFAIIAFVGYLILLGN